MDQHQYKSLTFYTNKHNIRKPLKDIWKLGYFQNNLTSISKDKKKKDASSFLYIVLSLNESIINLLPSINKKYQEFIR